MAWQAIKPKGILKRQPKTTPSTVAEPLPPATDPREIAIKHARIIHSRRELEDQIADSLIELSRFPTTREQQHDAANPAPADVQTFKDLVRLFQPGDYDNLIEERNANGLCGYTLCPNPKARIANGGTYKLVNYGRKDFNIVPRRELERWCSQKCAKRAMYVKVQLNETAAWERVGISSIHIDLYEEEHARTINDDGAEQLTRDMEKMKVETEQKAAQNARDLALERGDKIEQNQNPTRTFKLAIREKKVTMEATEPILDRDGHDHLLTEGYKTTFGSNPEAVIEEGK
ncbi:Rtr1/RPAP2 family-domain-containing protein [Xylariaceae sp. FL0594]|nr:Rtr1/RPAP2 family-domain-containing protein [Xylariaceae sp. FL0594]